MPKKSDSSSENKQPEVETVKCARCGADDAPYEEKLGGYACPECGYLTPKTE